MTKTKIFLVSHSVLQEKEGNIAWNTFRFRQSGSKENRNSRVKRPNTHKIATETAETAHLAHKKSMARSTVQRGAFEAASHAASINTNSTTNVYKLIRLFDGLSYPNRRGVQPFILHDSVRSLKPVECPLTKTCYSGDFFKYSSNL